MRALESGLTQLVSELSETARAGVRDGILPSEIYFTERLLVGLSRLRKVRVYRVSGHQEALKGCDIELWIWLPGGRFWRVALQAKRQYPSDRYEHLDHKNGQQLEDLENYSRAVGSIPGYLLYTHDTIGLPWHCTCPGDPDLLGVGLVPSWRVRQALKERGTRKPEFLYEPEASISLRCILHEPSHPARRLRLTTPPEGLSHEFSEWPGSDVNPLATVRPVLPNPFPDQGRPKYLTTFRCPADLEPELAERFGPNG